MGIITGLERVRFGHYTDIEGGTGCTVILCPPGTTGAAEVRGFAPGTREIDLLRPGCLVTEVHGLLLTGGSAFGLDAAAGVVRYLYENGVGFDTGLCRVPIVPAAVLYDLGVGRAVWPGPEAGYNASADAAGEGPVASGSVGAGTGATVGKHRGPDRAMMGGLGLAVRTRGDLVTAAVAAVNAMGDVYDEDNRMLAGARGDDVLTPGDMGWGRNTTLVAVVTNGSYSRDELVRLAVAGHNGIARTVFPSHTAYDGDTVFCLATGECDPLPSVAAAIEVSLVVSAAIRNAVLTASARYGIPAVERGPD